MDSMEVLLLYSVTTAIIYLAFDFGNVYYKTISSNREKMGFYHV